ncbi:MAG: FRG domain-containing protein [Nitrospirae bacterium]|nr:FRG domain-containing protein [Candidatus Manganitrophaceae bacterium]
MDISWQEYKVEVSGQLERPRAVIYRGQVNSDWELSSTIHRTGQLPSHSDFLIYFESILPFVQEPVEAWDGLRRNLSDPAQLAEFLAFLQHHGFPTPLLDWTFSPYIAAYFAFEGVNHFAPQYEKVAIYSFNQQEWSKTFKQTYDWKEKEGHVTFLNPTYRGNPKQMLQQGTFMFTNRVNIEEHILHNEKYEGQFLNKYEISVKERGRVFKELNAMNITALQLNPSMESVCKKSYEEICANLQMGLSPKEFKALLESLSAIKTNKQGPEKG